MGFQPEIEIPKNVRITEQWVEKNYDHVKSIMQFFLLYPDCFLDMVTPKNTNFHLFFYQRIALRAMIRYRYVYLDAPRAFSKSYLAILAGYIKCIFLPGEKFFIAAPGKGQSVSIMSQKLTEIWTIFPFLKKELVKYNMSSNEIRLVFKNGSTFQVMGALSATRGMRMNAGIIDEVRDHDGDVLNEIVLPTMNVDRRTALGDLDETEPNQSTIYITSAGTKGTFAYQQLIELFAQSIINPKSTFVMGCSYRVPMAHGLLNKSYIEDLKMSSTFKVDSFSREYLSLWTGGSADAWVDYDRLSRYRKKVNPEYRKIRSNGNDFYYIAVDVARIGVNTAGVVIHVQPQETSFRKTVVNVFSYHDMHFALQSIEIKKLIAAFEPQEVVIDATGMGVGLMDFLVMEQVDQQGNIWPPYSSFVKDDDYYDYPGEKILWPLKATPKLNSQIHTNCYNQLVGGTMRFLIPEQEAKIRLQALKISQTMKPAEKLRRLVPHMETTKMLDEICNLRIKNVTGDTLVEQINRNIPKDRFSALEYALWGVKEIEDKYYKAEKRKQINLRKFIMVN